jgi:hypothetical protein
MVKTQSNQTKVLAQVSQNITVNPQKLSQEEKQDYKEASNNFAGIEKKSWKWHNYQFVNQMKFNPNKEEIDHQKYIKALAESQDLVQESMQDKSS